MAHWAAIPVQIESKYIHVHSIQFSYSVNRVA